MKHILDYINEAFNDVWVVKSADIDNVVLLACGTKEEADAFVADRLAENADSKFTVEKGKKSDYMKEGKCCDKEDDKGEGEDVCPKCGKKPCECEKKEKKDEE